MTEMIDAKIMAEISLMAVIRHQYQRSMRTGPVPAPMTSSHFQAPAMELR